MPRSIRLSLLALGILALAPAATAMDAAAGWWQKLDVRDLDGAPLHPGGRWIVVVFLSPECPVANASIPVLKALAAEFAPHGVSLIGAYADPALDLAALHRYVSEYRLGFATADDRAQRLRRATGANYTPEVFVYSREGALLYRGRIDDRVTDFGAARPVAAHEELRAVLAALTAGQPGPFENRPGFGCSIPGPAGP